MTDKIMRDYNLKGKVAVVTGGSRGIGLEVARLFLEYGAKVAVCARKEEGLKSAQKQLNAGEDLLTICAHVAKEKEVEAMFETIFKHFGRVDILVNNVGMNLFTPSLSTADTEMWKKIIDTNLTGTFFSSRNASQIMQRQNEGKIVNITSIAGRMVAPGMGIYGVAKAGIEAMTRAFAVELASFNIQVNAVAPGMVRTDFSRPFWSEKDVHEQITASIPLGRIAEPAEVAQSVLYLSSSASSFITGQVIIIDGGATLV